MLGRIVGLTVVGLGLLGFLLTFGWVDIHPTEVGVVINKVVGKVEDAPLGVGYHFFNRWVTDVVPYVVSARAFPQDSLATEGHQNEWNLNLKTNDGQNINMDLTVIYSLKANEVPKLHATVGQHYEEQILLPQVRSEARLAMGHYSAEQIYQGQSRDEMQSIVRARLQTLTAQYPAINIIEVLVRDFRFSKEFEHAIEAKKLASQQVEVNRNLALAEEERAKQSEASARGEKLKAVQGAEGRAQSAKIEADAERYKLEQEAAGKLAVYQAEAEGKRLLAAALGGGQNVVALKFAETIPPTLQTWTIPVGQNNTSIMDISGILGNMFKRQAPTEAPQQARDDKARGGGWGMAQNE